MESFIDLSQTKPGTTQGVYDVMFKSPIVLKPNAQVIISDCFIDTSVPAQGGFVFGTDQTITIQVAYAVCSTTVPGNTDIAQVANQSIWFIINDKGDEELYIRNITLTIPAGAYSGVQLSKFITDELTKPNPNIFMAYPGTSSVNSFLPPNDLAKTINANGSTPAICLMSNDPDNIIDWTDYSPTDGSIFHPNIVIGTTQFALEYNTTGDNTFAFTQLHRPYYAANKSSQAVILSYDAPGYFVLPFESCVILADLQPAAFWQSLGFDLSTCTLKGRSATGTLASPFQCKLTDILACTTYPQIGLDFYDLAKTNQLDYLQPGLPASGHSVIVLVDQTKPVAAENQPQWTTDGFFIIDLQMMSIDSRYMTENALLNASALVSKTFLSEQGFAFNVSAVSMVNTSNTSMIISSARVRILDARTKQPATGLGSRNSVLLKIVN